MPARVSVRHVCWAGSTVDRFVVARHDHKDGMQRYTKEIPCCVKSNSVEITLSTELLTKLLVNDWLNIVKDWVETKMILHLALSSLLLMQL